MARRGIDGGTCRRTSLMLVSLTSMLVAALGLAQPARGQEAPAPEEAAAATPPSTETAAGDDTSSGDAATTPADSAASAEAADAAATAEPAPPEPAPSQPEPAPPQEEPVQPPADTATMEDAPAADQKPAESEAGTQSSSANPPNVDAGQTTEGGAAAPAQGCATTQTVASAEATSAPACAETTAPQPSEQPAPAPTPVAATAQATPAASAAPPETTPTIIIVVASTPTPEAPAIVQAAAPAVPDAAAATALPVAHLPVAQVAEADAVAFDPVALGSATSATTGLSVPNDGRIAAQRPAAGGKVAVRKTVAVRKLASCARPSARVPSSLSCARLRIAAVAAARLNPWPSIRGSAVELGEAARNVARERDRHPVRAKSKHEAPTIERAMPIDRTSDGPWASRGSAGGSSAGSVKLRVFALATMILLPFTLPRALRARIHASLVPTGELRFSLPERPG